MNANTIISRIKSFFGCLTAIIVLSIFAILIGLLLDIVPPISTWGPSYHILMADRGTISGDSIYLTNLRKNANTFSAKGFEKREMKMRSRILDYYIDCGDTLNINYAIAKIEFYSAQDGYKKHSDVILDAKEILWNSWKLGNLDDNGKQKLIIAILMSFNDKLVVNSEQELLDILAVVNSMECVTDDVETERQSILLSLVNIYMQDFNRWMDIQVYLDQCDPAQIDGKRLTHLYWVTMAEYQLRLHNTILAQEYLDKAKTLEVKDLSCVAEITTIQRSIYQAQGELLKYTDEGRNLIAIQNHPILKHLLKYENAIKRNKSWQKKYYYNSLTNYFTKWYQSPDEKDSISNNEIHKYNQILTEFEILKLTDYLNYIDKENIVHFFSELHNVQTEGTLTPEHEFQLIDLGIQAAILCTSDSSELMLNQYMQQFLSRIKTTFPYLTDGEKASFWKSEEPVLRSIYSAKDCEKIKYNIALLSKGLLLNSSNNVKRSILESNDSSLIADWNHLQMLRHQDYLATHDSLDVFQLRLLADSIEHSIKRRSISYQNYLETWDITWQDVQKQLGANECAVEYIKYPTDKKGEDQYAALILKPSCDPIFINLCKKSDIPRGNKSKYVEDSRLVELFWSQIVPHLSTGKIFVSMDGELHHINMESIPMANGKLLSEEFNIVRVSSTLELVFNEKATWNNPRLYGGVKYGLTKEEIQNIKRGYKAIDENIPRGYIFSRNKENIPQFAYLPHSLVEVQSIDSLLNLYGHNAQLFTNSEASEESFKMLSGQNSSIIHIATHGMFDDKKDQYADPMRCSYLLLAGANNSFIDPVKNNEIVGQDGILTASEISALDLRGTDLVILSACNTAQGEVTSDGVFGLQRAFKQAGAQTIIMTLWSIYDQSTSEFMLSFYKCLLDGKTKREAFNETIKKQRKKYPNDYTHWAGFIMLD
jgi:CHAT domain-containing protein